MAQIDKVIYIPLIFWFIILLVAVYAVVFSLFLSAYLSVGKARVLFFFELSGYVSEGVICVGGLKVYNAVKFITSSGAFSKIGN